MIVFLTVANEYHNHIEFLDAITGEEAAASSVKNLPANKIPAISSIGGYKSIKSFAMIVDNMSICLQ